MSLYMQYGAGLAAPEGWRHFDASPTLRLQRIPLLGRALRPWQTCVFPGNVEYGDIVRGLPIDRESCAGVYCSHVLEHLSLSGCKDALRNTRAYLVPGGTFRFVLPDLRHLARTYLESTDAGAAIAFLRESRLGSETRPGGARGLLHAWLSNTGHRWMWDYPSMEAELQLAGFRDIRPARFGDSSDPRFREVEAPDRWENALGVECRT